MSDPTENNEASRAAVIHFRKELMRQDEFDAVMAALGRMVSTSNFLEQNYRKLIAHLLRCQQKESALIVSRAIRGFDNVVEVTEKLFAVYIADQNEQSELKVIGTTAKGLQKDRDVRVHSLWYPSLQDTASPALRYKDANNAEPVSVEVSDLMTLSTKFDDCIQRLVSLVDRQHFS